MVNGVKVITMELDLMAGHLIVHLGIVHLGIVLLGMALIIASLTTPTVIIGQKQEAIYTTVVILNKGFQKDGFVKKDGML